MTCSVTAIIEHDQDGISAYCPQLKGCQAHAATMEEALVKLREAAEHYLQTLSPAEVRRVNSKTILVTSLAVTHG
jgi:predicted RNase H-like HicB family nuclease